MNSNGFCKIRESTYKKITKTEPQGVLNPAEEQGPSPSPPDISTRGPMPRYFLRDGCGPRAGRASPRRDVVTSPFEVNDSTGEEINGDRLQINGIINMINGISPDLMFFDAELVR